MYLYIDTYIRKFVNLKLKGSDVLKFYNKKRILENNILILQHEKGISIDANIKGFQ